MFKSARKYHSHTFDPPANDETMADNGKDLVILHHSLGFYGIPPYDHVEGDVV